MLSDRPNPITPAQIEASRRNRARSRGPKFAEGPQKSARISLKHGLATNRQAETRLVREIARCVSTLDRTVDFEASLLDHNARQMHANVAKDDGRLSTRTRAALAFRPANTASNDFQVLGRDELTCRPGLLACTAALDRIQTSRRRLSTIPAPQVPKLRNEPEPVSNLLIINRFHAPGTRREAA